MEANPADTAGARADVPGTGSEAAAPRRGLAEMSAWELPGVAHASGFERYEGAETSTQFAHEAGYDAYMTGEAPFVLSSWSGGQGGLG